MKTIETLLPHRAPFLFVDEVISASKAEIIGVKTFDDFLCVDESLPNQNFVPEMILIESMAQCGGAGIRQLEDAAGLFGLSNIEKAIFHNKVKCGKPVKMVIKNLRLGNRLIKQSGVAYVDGIPMVEATWVCMRFS